MTAPAGFIEVIAEFDVLPGLVAVGEIAVVSKATPTAGDAKSDDPFKGRRAAGGCDRIRQNC